jgi:hypothetical protein
MLSAMTLDQLGAKRCGKCGKRPERYYPAYQKKLLNALVHSSTIPPRSMLARTIPARIWF